MINSLLEIQVFLIQRKEYSIAAAHSLNGIQRKYWKLCGP